MVESDRNDLERFFLALVVLILVLCLIRSASCAARKGWEDGAAQPAQPEPPR